MSLLSLESSLPVVAAIHSRFASLLRPGDAEEIRLLVKRASSFHAVGQEITEELRGHGAKKILPVFSPVFDAGSVRRTRVSPVNPRLVFVGRADRRKGLDVLLRALLFLRTDFPELSLTILGDDGKTDPLLGGAKGQELARDLGLEQQISWLGLQTHSRVIEEMRQGDLLVSASREEGLVGVVLEAHSLGLPCVTTSASAEAMRWGESGMIVPSDNPWLLARALCAELCDPDRVRRAARNRSWALEQYSMERLLSGMRDDFSRVLSQNALS